MPRQIIVPLAPLKFIGGSDIERRLCLWSTPDGVRMQVEIRECSKSTKRPWTVVRAPTLPYENLAAVFAAMKTLKPKPPARRPRGDKKVSEGARQTDGWIKVIRGAKAKA